MCSGVGHCANGMCKIPAEAYENPTIEEDEEEEEFREDSEGADEE